MFLVFEVKLELVAVLLFVLELVDVGAVVS